MTTKIERSIGLLRKAESLALHMQPERGFWLAFSGGKDSQCIYHLAKMAGVKFEAHYSLTTLDHPELVRFIRNQYPDVVWDRPKFPFVALCQRKRLLPTRRMRFCCSEMKESMGKGFVTVTGVRRDESLKRRSRGPVAKGRDKGDVSIEEMQEASFQCVKGSDRFIVNPILEWTSGDVWHFLNDVARVPHCELYDKGYQRLGCLFCPMASLNSIRRMERDYPKYKAVLLRMIDRMIKDGCFEKAFPEATPELIWEWWISKENSRDFLMKRNQKELF